MPIVQATSAVLSSRRAASVATPKAVGPTAPSAANEPAQPAELEAVHSSCVNCAQAPALGLCRYASSRRRRSGQRVTSLPLPAPSVLGRPTLVLDLDSTLIGSIRTRPRSSTQFPTTAAAADGVVAAGGAEPAAAAATAAASPYRRAPDYAHEKYQVWLRPGAKEFLAAVRPHFEVVLFTAANEEWAITALRLLDPEATLFDKM